jgi:hypothetical protein
VDDLQSGERMKQKKIIYALISIVSVFSMLRAQDSGAPILSPEQVQAGMTGKGRTVFLGSQIEEFDVEILGILRNDSGIGAKRSLILARLSGEKMKKNGVAQGMSGSPVYIDGKLIGAVAYSFPFAKEAIAGITPIDEMLTIEKESGARSAYSPSIPIKKTLSLKELYEINKSLFEVESPLMYRNQALQPLKIPLIHKGFSPRALNRMGSVFTQMGFHLNQAEQDQVKVDPAIYSDMALRAGEPVGVQLISGDLEMAATGTVTHVEGNQVLAFGHPLYNLGPVDYAMTKARVITVVPSLDTSFKLTATGAVVGRFRQDRTSGVLGEIGKPPELIPVNIKLVHSTQDVVQDIRLKIVDDKILTPFLMNAAVAGLMYTEERALGDLTVEMAGDIYLENGQSLHLEDMFSGNFDTAVAEMTGLVTSITYFLTNNEFRDLGIHRVDLNLRTVEQVQFSYLEKVWLDKYDVKPGERIHMKIYTRNFRGESIMQEGGIVAPHLPPGSEFYLIIGDTQSMGQLESGLYRTQVFTPRNVSQLIRILSNLRKNNRIYFKILARKPGLFLKGEELPNLPPSMKSMFSSPRAATSQPTELSQSTLSHFQLPVPFVFKGSALIPIKIK